jgi:hypothetical protein
MIPKPSRLDYCQFLLVSQINYTITHFSDHTQNQLSHDAINRYLSRDTLTPALIWENVSSHIEMSENGYLVFDDTVLDKNHSHKIQMVSRQYSGNAHGLIKGIGLVNCVYVNPDTAQYWVIDYRIYDLETDGKTKIDHVHDMLIHTVEQKNLAFKTVLMDSWYATKNFMFLIDSLDKIFYCPLKSNRLVDDSAGELAYRHVDALTWADIDLTQGKLIKIKGFPKDYKVKLFRVEVSTHRTDWVVTNDLSQDSLDDTQEVCAMRWKIEQFHRELKQLTGIERNQCRKRRIQRNHIACAILVWVRLAELARKTKQTMYRLKQGLLDDYLIDQLKNPTILMRLA